MVDIPTQFTFEHLMSHTFPGFFSAVTLFMLIDVWSPLNLTALAIKDIAGLGTFVGFVLLIGSILGIIIDGIYHSIIEDDIFDKIEGVKDYKEKVKEICFDGKKIEDNANGVFVGDKLAKDVLSHYYFIEQLGGENAIKIYQNVINSYYCYARFYSNTFIALIPFIITVPFYLLEVLQISWISCIFIAITSFFMACFCLNSGYVAYRAYNRALFSAIYGYVKKGEASSGSKPAGGNITVGGNIKVAGNVAVGGETDGEVG